MAKSLKKFFTKKIVLAFTLFMVTVTLLACTVKQLWFREDDLGVIINGLIRSWDDFIKVFSADERSFACPVNYLRSKPNVLSGFARPLKNIFFSLVYYFQGLNVYAYYYLHVVFHALNAVLFFHLLSLWTSLGLAFLGGLLFAFYPDISWMTWIATFHNSLTTFLLLLSIICFYSYWNRSKKQLIAFHMLFLSALTFFLSLLSRETGVFFPFWMFSGVFLLTILPTKKFWLSCKTALAKTWVFFAVNVVYVLYKLAIFGVGSLDRTYNNLFLRFPFLAKFFKPTSQTVVSTAQAVKTTVTQTLPAAAEHVEKVIPVATTQPALWEKLLAKGEKLSDVFFTWSKALFSIESNTLQTHLIITGVWVVLASFLFHAYRSSKSLFLFFLIGFGIFAWPGILAYPSPRYINCAFPVIIALVIFGMHQIIKKHYQTDGEKSTVLALFGLCCFAIFNGAINNAVNLRNSGYGNSRLKERYEVFFNENTFDSQANFMLVSCPFGSDTQNIFQYFTKNFDLQLAEEPFGYLSQNGIFGCTGDYQIKEVKRKIVPIKDGFRITSLDKEHCACSLRLSNHPLQWVEEEKAYRWKKNLHEVGKWHRCSVGKFMIHERLEDEFVTDISFVFDKKWIDENTVFVSWDTEKGKYIKLDASHLK